jgi:predicted TIM-barrel fold metal-dependent hydrolase
MIKNTIIFPLIVASIFGCTEKKLNFETMSKIDAHVHIRYNGPELLDQAKKDNFKVLAIMTDHYDINWQERFIEKQKKNHPNQFEYITTFTMKDWDNPEWQSKTIAHLKEAFDEGAIGIKIWKNVGMEYKDTDSNFVMIDNPRFDPIFNFIESQGKTLTGHIGEPRDCWLPLDEMLANSNRRYYSTNPQYHMYRHPDHPSYDQQINSYKKVLEKHPNLRYVGCHLASIEWNLKELAKVLDEFPNLAVDLAARIDDLQLLDSEEVGKFFMTYQDRILYGTDLSIKEEHDPKTYAEHAHQTWMNDWKYFTTDSLLSLPGLDQPVRGLNLPAVVIEKIYRLNAEKWYPGI